MSATVKQAFIAKLLAPIGEGAEAADTPEYRRRLHRDLSEAWRRDIRHVFAENYLRHWHMERASIEGDRGGNRIREREYREGCKQAQRLYVAAVDHMMRLPAPGKGELAWKRRHRALDGGSPDWEAAIARDEARLK